MTDSILSIIPQDDTKKMGQRKETYDAYEPLKVTDWQKFSVRKGTQESCLKAIGEMLDQVLVDNPHTLRIFSPDELVSNKLDAVFKHTQRNFQWDETSNANGGRVIEMLSEHTLEGFLQGYTLTGRVGVFPSYESFLGIVQTMMVQYGKFAKMVRLPAVLRCIAFLILCSHERLLGVNILEVSTILRRARGLARYDPEFLPNRINLSVIGTQWFLSSEPIIHRRSPQSKTGSRACLSATGCKYVPVNLCSLSAIEELHQPDGWIETTRASLSHS